MVAFAGGETGDAGTLAGLSTGSRFFLWWPNNPKAPDPETEAFLLVSGVDCWAFAGVAAIAVSKKNVSRI